MKEWKDTCPVIIAPTTYYTESNKVFEDMGISIVIWANMMMRASISNMRKIAKAIYDDKTLSHITDGMVPLKEIFELQNMAELKNAEIKYLPHNSYSAK